MNHRERFLRVMNYQPVDRCVYGVWTGAWPETYEVWKTQGYDPAKEPYFQVDNWCWQGGWFFPNPPFAREVIAEDDNTITYVNYEGILMRERKDNPWSSMPQFLRFPAETPEAFRAFMRDRMQPDLGARIGADYVAKLTAYKDRDFPLMVVADRWGGFFGGLRNMTGVEKLCMYFYDDPDFIDEMSGRLADFIIAMMSQILDYTDVDVFGFWEDMAYKTGPLCGPDTMRRFMLPHYKRVVDYVRGRGVPFVSLDSDGDVSSLIPVWLDAGVNILYPFEVQCGMDVLQVRKEYGRDLRLWFGIDKRALAIGPAAIDAELARVRPLVEEGGYIPGLDHSMPPDVPFANYLYYMEKLRTIL